MKFTCTKCKGDVAPNEMSTLTASLASEDEKQRDQGQVELARATLCLSCVSPLRALVASLK